MKAETAARMLVEKIVFRFGTPRSIHSDQGRQFESILFQHTCELLGIKKSHSSAYHPQGNGIAERAIKTLKERLRNIILDSNSEWDQVMEHALMTMNTTKNETTNITPYQLVYGRFPRSINSIDIQKVTNDNSVHVSVEELARKIVNLEEAAKANIEANQMKYKFYYDRDCHYQEIKPGSWVRIKQPNPSAFSSRYGKPVRVVRAQIPGTYIVEDGKGKQAVVHHNRLKMHHIDEKYLVPPLSKRPIKVPDQNTEFKAVNLPNLGWGGI
ncbi:Retrovirus-related Pol polyprotein [Thelohanellus kitauei]|uniref:Retrovirus-related Pol polyprotein n=1 Tax=Thelohanellus kitauei TaxID=669202 RepID=A0A0C2JXU7_THEKT|nr:Retrovirus-related Pol polyprotein [Thelohanellus kitauei]